jgi:hypothetical protein
VAAPIPALGSFITVQLQRSRDRIPRTAILVDFCMAFLMVLIAFQNKTATYRQPLNFLKRIKYVGNRVAN